MPIRTYEGAVTLVTGGASGIGRALGEELARRHAEVWLADLQHAAAEEVAARIRRLGGRATAVHLDVTDGAAFERVVAELFAKAGRLDYFFNNAGILVMGNARFYEAPDWDKQLDVNVRGVCNGVRAVYPRMVAQGFGHIVNTASVAGLVAIPLLTGYSMTKHAVVGLSKALRVEAAGYGVRVSALCPGVIRTPIVHGGVFGRALHTIEPERMQRVWEQWLPSEVEPLVEGALACVARNEGVIVLPRWLRALTLAVRVAPALETWLTKMQLERARKLLPELERFQPRDGREMVAEAGLLDRADVPGKRTPLPQPN
ncbi:MAG: SDR family oxidoreductase [Deltaproteobacteria bacterium]|nr:SDR family oxidoreductase [Deltaproteobacteria bacterium]